MLWQFIFAFLPLTHFITRRMSVMDDLGDIEFMQEEDNRGGREGENVDQHKSVIMHLIKQVKIGMDLTRGTYIK